MSQAGITSVVDHILPPDVPTSFVTDSGTAVPIGNILQVKGTTQAAGSTPVHTTGATNVVTSIVQTSQAIASTDATKIGLSAFNSSQFSVDANGFVSITGSGITLVTTYTSGSGTFNINANTQWVRAILIGGGGGGGSGRKGSSTASAGGSGGSPGGVTIIEGSRSAFSGGLSYTVGASAGGGSSQNTDATNGNPGTSGNNTTLGNIVALGGTAGPGGTNANAGQTSGVGSYLNYLTSTSLANGGGGRIINGNPPSALTPGFNFLPNGGGGGGGGDTATPRAGATGGSLVNIAGTTLLAGANGGVETGTIGGSDGSPAYLQQGIYGGGMGGGGGGGASSGNTGGKGGNGSAPGGGGGGGGGGISAQANSGAGGNGADGIIIIIEWL